MDYFVRVTPQISQKITDKQIRCIANVLHIRDVKDIQNLRKIVLDNPHVKIAIQRNKMLVPDEIVQAIFKYMDIPTIYKLSKINKLLYRLLIRDENFLLTFLAEHPIQNEIYQKYPRNTFKNTLAYFHHFMFGHDVNIYRNKRVYITAASLLDRGLDKFMFNTSIDPKPYLSLPLYRSSSGETLDMKNHYFIFIRERDGKIVNYVPILFSKENEKIVDDIRRIYSTEQANTILNRYVPLDVGIFPVI